MNLPSRLRPISFSEFLGQHNLVDPGKILRSMVEKDNLQSIILWGPPGSGKTTLASIIAHETKSVFHTISGVTAGKNDLLEIVEKARDDSKNGKRTILFIDEVHRWNKAQQDVLLPYVESGLITLIGATTENPSFEVNSALLSRSRVFVLQSLEKKDLEKLIDRALSDKEKGLGSYKKKIDATAKLLLIRFSGGDARVLLNALEMAVISYKEKTITPEIIQEIFQKKSAGLYDKKR